MSKTLHSSEFLELQKWRQITEDLSENPDAWDHTRTEEQAAWSRALAQEDYDAALYAARGQWMNLGGTDRNPEAARKADEWVARNHLSLEDKLAWYRWAVLQAKARQRAQS